MLNNKEYKIAVAGTGYVGLSNAILLAQNNQVYAVDIVPEKVELINNKKSPIRRMVNCQQWLGQYRFQRQSTRLRDTEF